MNKEQAKKLEYPFAADEIEWRVCRTTKDKTKGQVAAYVDSRAIQERLDTVLGRDNWQNHFCTVTGKDKNSITHICEISIFYADRGEWITKSNGAGCTDFEPIKGGLSNAFKRAASMWGIGRYLYNLTGIWIPINEGKYIPNEQLPELKKQYKQFVNQYLAAGKSSEKTNSASVPQNAPAQNAAAATVVSVTHTPPKGQSRFNRQNTAAQKDSWKITDVQVSKGGSGAQTLVTLQNSAGKSLSGYIRGAAPLKTGQSLCDLKVTKKNSPIVGDYNIVESYQMAA